MTAQSRRLLTLELIPPFSCSQAQQLVKSESNLAKVSSQTENFR